MQDRSFLIGVAGPSASGKTFLAEALARQLDEVLIFGCDSYYHDLSHLSEEQVLQHNLDHPDAVEHERLAEDLAQLRAGKTAQTPIYDYTTHQRSKETRVLSPRRFIIVDGLHILHWPQVRELLDLKVFVEAPHEVCLARRIKRDLAARGRTEDEVRHRYVTTVQPMCDRYIMPSRRFADVVVDGRASVEEGVAKVMSGL